ncbi:MAG: hypothetical protein P8Y53_19315 [Pseudolabrys sp.]
MIMHDTRLAPADDHGPVPIGLSALATLAFNGCDLAPLWNELVGRATADSNDAAAWLDLSTIAHLQGRPDDRLALQSVALKLCRLYHQPPAAATARPLRLLALMAPGDFMANIPIEFMLAGSDVALDMLYVVEDEPLPPLPEHDVALVAIAEQRANQALLGRLAAQAWPKPLLNAPAHIARLTRAGTWALLKSAPGVTMPMNADIGRAELARIAQGALDVGAVLDGACFPIIARPQDSHAGKGLEKLDDAGALAAYLAARLEQEFSIAPFIDYRSADGLFRKARVALIAGKPYPCHMAVSEHWMIHYLNAGMRERPERRAEEADFFATFDDDFARRHARAFAAIAERFALDYIPFDCGETPDGQLLVFEAGTNMIVHSMDPPELFPYKPPQMQKVFGAFQAMLRDACAMQAEAAVA